MTGPTYSVKKKQRTNNNSLEIHIQVKIILFERKKKTENSSRYLPTESTKPSVSSNRVVFNSYEEITWHRVYVGRPGKTLFRYRISGNGKIVYDISAQTIAFSGGSTWHQMCKIIYNSTPQSVSLWLRRIERKRSAAYQFCLFDTC